MTDWLEELLALAEEGEEREAPLSLLLPAAVSLAAEGRTGPAPAAGTAEPGGQDTWTAPALWESGPEEPDRAGKDGQADLAWLFQGGAAVRTALETGRAGRETLSGLEGLYRRATEGALAPAPVPAAPAGRDTARGEAPAAGLTAEELDRAVRRDSRRYDGAMSIY